MKTKDFNTIVEQRCNKIKAVLAKKASEYSFNDNRLHNFDVAARLKNETRERALLGMLIKHEVSTLDIIDNLDKGILPSVELLDEKLGDYINYLILLEASIKDRINKQI